MLYAIAGVAILAAAYTVVWAMKSAKNCTCDRPECGGGCAPSLFDDPDACDMCHGSGRNWACQVWPGRPCRYCAGTGRA